MKWHTKRIARKIFALIVCLLIILVMVLGFLYVVRDGDTKAAVFLVVMLLFMGLVMFSTSKDLIDAINTKKEATKENVEISSIQHRSFDEQCAMVNCQIQSPLYKDDKITITNDFVVTADNKYFVIDGVLDVVPFVQRVNGVVEYVSLIMLYNDGKSYEIKYRRPLGISNMGDVENRVCFAANIIANRSSNYRRYPNYRLVNN